MTLNFKFSYPFQGLPFVKIIQVIKILQKMNSNLQNNFTYGIVDVFKTV